MSEHLYNDIPYFSCILARDQYNGGIGFRNNLPWKIDSDIKRFKEITTGGTDKENIVIMGKCTFNSIGNKPLKNRINIVVSTTMETIYENGQAVVYVVSSLNSALQLGKRFGKGRYIFVIGGTQLFKEAFYHPFLETIYITQIKPYHYVEYDTFFNFDIPSGFDLVSRDSQDRNGYVLYFEKYNKIVLTQEKFYTDLLEYVLTNGEERDDRTGVGTLSYFSPQIYFDLNNSFPLLTTKQIPLRIVFEELMWFLRGQTNNKILQEKRVHIWDGNSSREYMQKVGLSHYPEGELGPVYGAQWRNFGGVHDTDKKEHINDGGIDQISDVIYQIRTNPTSRRMIVCAWNPKALPEMALPPCHVMFQFYVHQKRYLYCKLVIRSNDLFLGAPFNIASYSLLVYMIAAMCDLVPGKLIYSIGDAHIYKNHIDQVNQQILRPHRPFPKLIVKNVRSSIEDFEFDDFELVDYEPHPTIKAEMAV